MLPDLVLLPHCDLHVSLDRPQPRVKVYLRTSPGDPTQPYALTPVLPAPSGPKATFDFYAPHAPPGQRFANLPTVQPDGQVIATRPGIYLFQCTYDGHSIVGRLQVHQEIRDWWFGNDSITTALDATFGHAQPTIYAEFSDDAGVGTDLIGDITGHGYVNLESSDSNTMVVVDEFSRVRGLVRSPQPVNLIGTFLGKERTLPVRVVEYERRREILEPVVHDPKHDPAKAPNLLFLGEGFTESTADKITFDEIAGDIYNGMFIKPRHRPFEMLRESMNVYKAPTVSAQDLLTCGFRVADGPYLTGRPIPYRGEVRTPGLPQNAYSVLELIHRVGLPKRAETRSVDALITEWGTQHLTDFEPGRAHSEIVERWRHQQSKGMFQARDTLFGLHLGQRPADHVSDREPVQNPGPTGGGEPLRAFVRRLYGFYDTLAARHMMPDPRRHPPQLYARDMDNPLISIFRYIGGLAERLDAKRDVGPQWIPTQSRLTRSRGLVIVIANDVAEGGQNIENGHLACLTLDVQTKLGSVYGSPAAGTMRRGQATYTYDKDTVTDIAVHELGHSFNLGDEYEETDGAPGPNDSDFNFDNLMKLSKARKKSDPPNPPSPLFDPMLVKWLRVPRMALASRVSAVKPLPDGVEVTVPPEDVPHWRMADLDELSVYLWSGPSPIGVQLPFFVDQSDPSKTHHSVLGPFDIRRVSRVHATVDLRGNPPANPSEVGEGSMLFIPVQDAKGEIRRLAEPAVFAHLANGLPLNARTSSVPTADPDTPHTITGFIPKAPPSSMIGVYEGGGKLSRETYRPAGMCKMRNQHHKDNEGAFCFVCQWLIVNRLNPAKHRELDQTYPLGKTHA